MPNGIPIPSRLSAPLRRICELELSLGNEIVETRSSEASPIQVYMRDVLHYDEIEKGAGLPPEAERWKNVDPHFAIEGGYACTLTKHLIAAPIPEQYGRGPW